MGRPAEPRAPPLEKHTAFSYVSNAKPRTLTLAITRFPVSMNFFTHVYLAFGCRNNNNITHKHRAPHHTAPPQPNANRTFVQYIYFCVRLVYEYETHRVSTVWMSRGIQHTALGTGGWATYHRACHTDINECIAMRHHNLRKLENIRYGRFLFLFPFFDMLHRMGN